MKLLKTTSTLVAVTFEIKIICDKILLNFCGSQVYTVASGGPETIFWSASTGDRDPLLPKLYAVSSHQGATEAQ